ncbi:MAG: o-succinylbenzoate synthase [Meiothermus sp.]|uniref:o-succinylbenzoate synthase n=1 Tax=Meiothermus sp. TaxID=1955249 RepID=UPI0025ECA4E8|nr:o-succinylbenzoate synthase [Meiothermus sp.]MCS7058229.1 o-succinylbenzoate synthase [Meiothermus sp.]MCS7194740.1 o-succinylbenzoate synthase [Meiothermus sp.]MCX7739489.1 o-succinylbenzoate synthase [Meiothermus sp.]MDW8091407.1 o-succinylbenzoate synthase [Meiothermus sp.]MDW8481338.1 o-succinylbenzoate synthase [Meiothermus sp.]
MKIEAAELRLISLPLKFRFETSFGVQTERHIIVLTLYGEGLEGYAETVMEYTPHYREETIPGAWALLEGLLLPRVLGREFANPELLWGEISSYRGNKMTKAALEMAFWDLWCKGLGQPIWKVLGGVRQEIPVGISLGIEASIETTLEKVAKGLSDGYKRIKLKIKPGWDVKVALAVREAFPEANLTVDANSAYSLNDIATFRALDAAQLDYIEQPLAYDDLLDHAKLQSAIATSICLDESITSPEDARKALEIGAGRVINLKPARVGGILQSRKVHDIAQSYGLPVWMGGMLEAGIGRAANIHVATLPMFVKPGDTSSASRYWQEDIVEEALEARGGMMPVPQGPGLGVTLKRDFLKRITEKTAYLTSR